MNTARKTVLFLSAVLLLGYLCTSSAPKAQAADTKQPAKLELSAEETEFIREHPVIRLSVDPTFVPYEFFDSDGAYKGIAADYIDLICQETGLQMVPEKNLTWADAYDRAVKRDSDVLPCVSMTKQRQDYFLFSAPYYTFQRAVYITKDNNTVKSIDDLSGKTVAVQANSSHQGFLTAYYPAINQSMYNTVEDALRALSDGKETSFIGNLATTNYLIKNLGITNLKYISVDAGDNQSLYFAVRNDWPVLVGIINKALAAITQEEKIAISNKWLGVQEEPDYSHIIRIAEITGGITLLILIVSGFWILRLRREIAKRKRAQAELSAAKEEAERANQIKSLFLARMSHEVRTPLHTIMGMAHLFKKTEMTTTQGLYLDKLTQAARNMLSIINDILDFSKIEAGKIDIEHVTFDLDNILQRVLNIESVRVEEQGIELMMHKKPDMPRFYIGDPVRIEQILLNIVSNAIKFTKKGSVTLTVGDVPTSGKIHTVAFTVADTGIGMSEEQIERLFVPFDQADSSISRRFGGTGLGMSIVKNLIDLMAGTIEVTSVPGEGSTFDVRLPLEADTENEKIELEKMAADCFKNIRALILDKSDASGSLLESCLQSFGIVSDRAASEYEALLLTRKASEDGHPHSLMIVDYQTPEENGIVYVNRRKKQSAGASQMKYILVLPMAKEELFEELEAAGINFGITKPVIPSVLYNCIIDMFAVKPAEKIGPAGSGKTHAAPYPYGILLVEDNKTNQYIAQTILEQAGFTVIIADDGGDGLRIFKDRRQDIDLVLMDIHMPDMDGYTASDLIREIDRDVPIVAMTADAISGVTEKCKSHSMEHYVSKPFEPDELIDTILRVLKEKNRGELPGPHPPEEGDGDAVLDRADGLRRIGGDQDIYRLILQEYLNENRDTDRLLREILDSKDYRTAVQLVHKTKSSSGNIGSKRLYAAASELQNALAASDEAVIPAKFRAFSQLLSQVLEEIISFLG